MIQSSMNFFESSSNTWRPKEPPCLDGMSDLEFDCETSGLQWYAKDRPIGISLHTPDGKKRYLPWGHLGGGNLDEATMKRWCQRELRGKYLYGANIRFDVHHMREWGIDLEEQGCTVSDIQHDAALLDDHRRKFALDVLGKDFIGRGKLGQELDKKRMAEYHAGEVAAYAEEDVQLVHDLRKVMQPQIIEQGLLRVQQLESDLIFPVCEMEKNAAPIDVELLHKWVKETEVLLNSMLLEIAKTVGFQMNPDKGSDWVRLFRYYKIPVTHFTETGQPSFTDFVLKSIDNPVVQMARKAGKLASLRSKFLIPYFNRVGADGLLRYELHQLRVDNEEGGGGGTISGRFSCSNVNIQQVMTKEKYKAAFGDLTYYIRKLFVPGNGLYFCADAAQIEYRIFAHFAENPSVLEGYKKDPWMSFHKHVHELVKPFKPDLPYRRQKDINFARMYSAGISKISHMIELPIAETEAIIKIYDKVLPEVKSLLRHASNLAKNRGWVHTLLGRRARYPDGERAHKSLNSVIQGGAADIMKMKLITLHRERKYTGLTLRMTVHDEADGNVPDKESAKRVEEVLQRQEIELRVPILWECGTGPNWAEAKV